MASSEGGSSDGGSSDEGEDGRDFMPAVVS